jgi:hypothetical protein
VVFGQTGPRAGLVGGIGGVVKEFAGWNIEKRTKAIDCSEVYSPALVRSQGTDNRLRHAAITSNLSLTKRLLTSFSPAQILTSNDFSKSAFDCHSLSLSKHNDNPFTILPRYANDTAIYRISQASIDIQIDKGKNCPMILPSIGVSGIGSMLNCASSARMPIHALLNTSNDR